MFVLPDFRELEIDAIRTILDATGYLTNAAEFDFAKDNDYFKFIGCYDGKARYLVAFESDEDGSMYVSIVYVYIGNNGTLNADYSAMPVFESEDEDAIADYIEKRCN